MKLQDFLHLYLGCKIRHSDNEYADLIGVIEGQAHFIHEASGSYGFCSIESPFFGKPLLRPLSDMTIEEKSEYIELAFSVCPVGVFDVDKGLQSNAAVTAYLLSKHFDLFNLIENGLALDASKIKQSI